MGGWKGSQLRAAPQIGLDVTVRRSRVFVIRLMEMSGATYGRQSEGNEGGHGTGSMMVRTMDGREEERKRGREDGR